MKFRPSLKSAKYLALIAATVATAIAGSIAPSQAEQPSEIFRQRGFLQEYAFFPQANLSFLLPSNCPAVRELFSGAPTTIKEFAAGRNDTPNLLCNSEVPGFTSPAFGSNAGVILTPNDAFYVKSDAFFKAMKITPTKLTEQQGKDLIAANPRIINSVVLETRIAPPRPPAPAPLPPIRLPALASVPPDVIVTYPNHASLAIFNSSSEAFLMACPAVRDLWRGVREQQAANREEYFKLLSFKPTRFGQTTRAADLYCNSPSQVQGYVSPAFAAVPGRPAYAGAIVVNGKTYMLNNPEFFGAMGIKPTLLNEQQARDLMNNATFGFTNLTIQR